jgi:hypothetical protein
MIERVNGKLSIKARNLALKDVAAVLHQDFGVEIKGREELGNKKITFDQEAISLEELIRGLLRHLNIKNYAFEFAEEKLRTVTLMDNRRRLVLQGGFIGVRIAPEQVSEQANRNYF